MNDYSDKPITCEEVQQRLDEYLMDDPGLMKKVRTAIETHLAGCPACAHEYEENRWVIGLVREYWPVDPVKEIVVSERSRMTAQQSWEDLKLRVPGLAQKEKQWQHRRRVHWISAAAACLILAISSYVVLSNRFTFEPPSQTNEKPDQQVASVCEPSIKIELVSKTGKITVPARQEITTAGDQKKTILISDKHRMVMNTDTTLTIEPLIQDDHIGCMVKLSKGEIYTHVEHDGNPFIVETIHGQAVITGTTFDIKASETAMTLVVSEGTVRLESEKGMVEVKAGQLAKITGQSAPSPALACNITEFTAWAKYCRSNSESMKTQVLADSFDISGLSFLETQEPVELEIIDYDKWVEEHRGWFKQEFPWIFQLQDALAKENIEVDYPELLIKSGDIWQFVCLKVSPLRFSVIDPNSLIKTASDFGFDKIWLLENVPTAKSVLEKSMSSENSFAGPKAFEQWLKYASDENKSPMPMYSYYASKYLAQTRSLIWFTVKDGKFALIDHEYIEILRLLQEEVTVACECQNDVMYFTDKPKRSCCEKKSQETLDDVISNIKKIKAIEERMSKYEMNK